MFRKLNSFISKKLDKTQTVSVRNNSSDSNSQSAPRGSPPLQRRIEVAATSEDPSKIQKLEERYARVFLTHPLDQNARSVFFIIEKLWFQKGFEDRLGWADRFALGILHLDLCFIELQTFFL